MHNLADFLAFLWYSLVPVLLLHNFVPVYNSGNRSDHLPNSVKRFQAELHIPDLLHFVALAEQGMDKTDNNQRVYVTGSYGEAQPDFLNQPGMANQADLSQPETAGQTYARTQGQSDGDKTVSNIVTKSVF